MKRERDDAPSAAHGAGSNKRARGNDSNDNNRKSSGFGMPNSGSKAEVRTLKSEREEDPHRLAQRQKQIDYGKNTLGYDRYCAMVPRNKRRKGEHPMTPDKTLNVSKKHFDSMVRRWRQALHDYDPPELAEQLRAAEQQAAIAPAQEAATTSTSVNGVADVDPELADLDPSKQPSTTAAPSIFDAFDEDEGAAVDCEDDDDDDLL